MVNSDVLENRAITPFDVSGAEIYSENRWQEPFAQLRREMPVSYLPDSPYGPYWSVVTHDLVQQVELDPKTYSSSYEVGGITITDGSGEYEFPNFIAMDAPTHTAQHKVVQPSFNPSEMLAREPEIRARTRALRSSLSVIVVAPAVMNICVSSGLPFRSHRIICNEGEKCNDQFGCSGKSGDHSL